MKTHQAATVLAMALSICSGCRTTSVAYRSTTPSAVRPTASGIAGHSVANDTGRLVATEATESNRSADFSESELIQQVSAETSNDDTASSKSTVAPMTFTLRAAIETALAQNPDLIALRQAEGVGTAAVGVADTYPINPWVQVQVTPYQRSQSGGSGTTGHYVLLMQQIQLGHQQRFREEGARAALNSIRWNVMQAELTNVAQTERLYFMAIYQQGLRDLANFNAQNNEQLLVTLERQQEAGQATAADVAIVRLDARSTRQQQRIAEANLRTALLDLKRHLCLQPDCDLTLDDSVFRWNWKPASPAEVASLAACRPDVMVARSDTDTARANTSIANGSRTPDLLIGPYYQRDDFGTVFVGFRGQMDIPVINNGMPLLRQREAELCQRMVTAQQLATRAYLESQAAADRYERARDLRREDGNLKTAMPVELQRLEEQFKANEVDILRVFQARNSLMQNQRADLDALNELMQAAVAITASSGMPVELLVDAAEPPVELPDAG